MGTTELSAAAREYRELQRLREELDAELEAVKDRLKAELDARGVDELITGEYRITYKAVKSSRVDATALKAALPDVYAAFAKTTESRRFCVA